MKQKQNYNVDTVSMLPNVSQKYQPNDNHDLTRETYSKFYSNRRQVNEWAKILAYRTIGLISKVFTNGLGDRGSILGWVIPKTPKMVLDAALLSTQYYKVRIKGKV